MAETYNQYINEQVNNSKTQGDTAAAVYENAAKSAYNQWLNGLSGAADAARSAAAAQAADAERRYGAVQEANALQETVGREQLREAMAKAGLTGQGLNHTQDTALALMRGNADYKTREQQKSAVEDLQLAMSRLEADWLAQQSSTKAGMTGNASKAAQDYRGTLYNKAVGMGASIYGTETDAQLTRDKLAQQKILAEVEDKFAREKLAEEKRQADLMDDLQRKYLEKLENEAEKLKSSSVSTAAQSFGQYVLDLAEKDGGGSAANSGTGQKTSSQKTAAKEFNPLFLGTPVERAEHTLKYAPELLSDYELKLLFDAKKAGFNTKLSYEDNLKTLFKMYDMKFPDYLAAPAPPKALNMGFNNLAKYQKDVETLKNMAGKSVYSDKALREMLDKFGVKYNPKANRATLEALINREAKKY